MASITCGNCKESHASVADVRACFAGRLVTAGAPARPSEKDVQHVNARFADYTDPQLLEVLPLTREAGLRKLVTEELEARGYLVQQTTAVLRTLVKGTEEEWEASQQEYDDMVARAGESSSDSFDASDKAAERRLAQRAFAAPAKFTGGNKQTPSPVRQSSSDAPAAEGFYFLDGKFYKVQQAKYGSGRNYAKVFVAPARKGEKGSWDYAKGVVYRLTEKHRVTKAQAAKFGALYGRCIRCGRVLTAEESIDRSMGPVCSDKMGW